MGSDNIFHKRKHRKLKELARTKAKRSSYDRVLIVCEGNKTEPNYLQELVDHLKLNTANIEIDGTPGSSPKSVVDHAIKLYKNEEKINRRDSYDRVYCVFDKDTHTTYDEAIEIISNVKTKNVFKCITSVPSFEYWLLLHYVYTTKPFVGTERKSASCLLIDELKKYNPKYDKGKKGIYVEIKDNTEQAINYSKNALDTAIKSNTDNPTTNMHILIDYLQQLKK